MHTTCDSCWYPTNYLHNHSGFFGFLTFIGFLFSSLIFYVIPGRSRGATLVNHASFWKQFYVIYVALYLWRWVVLLNYTSSVRVSSAIRSRAVDGVITMHSPIQRGNTFSRICLCACRSCSGSNFWKPSPTNFIDGTQVHLPNT